MAAVLDAHWRRSPLRRRRQSRRSQRRLGFGEDGGNVRGFPYCFPVFHWFYTGFPWFFIGFSRFSFGFPVFHLVLLWFSMVFHRFFQVFHWFSSIPYSFTQAFHIFFQFSILAIWCRFSHRFCTRFSAVHMLYAGFP